VSQSPVGRPLTVSKSDAELPLSRVRRIEILSTSWAAAPLDDPSFKAVVVDPRVQVSGPLQPKLAGILMIKPAPFGFSPQNAISTPVSLSVHAPSVTLLEDAVKAPSPDSTAPSLPATTLSIPSPEKATTVPDRPSDSKVPADLQTHPSRTGGLPPPLRGPANKLPHVAESKPTLQHNAAPPTPRFGPIEIGAARAMSRF
jgi:hypothetical protein